MELVYSEAGIYYCGVYFRINGIDGDMLDFGDKESGGRYGDYGCRNMHFVPCKPTEEVLMRFGISKEDYAIVTDMLIEQLAFGCCSMCE